MAKVNASSLKQWQDGQVMHGPDYNQERDLIVAAYNNTQEQVDVLKGVGGVGTSQLQDNAVTTPKINNGAVTTDKLATGAVTADKLGTGAVTNQKLGDSSVTSAKLSILSVSTEKLVDLSVKTEKIADGAVTPAKLADGAVQTAKLAPDSVTNDKISIDAVRSNNLQQFSVTTPKINTGAVTSEKLADGAVTPTKIVESAITQFAYNKAQTDQQIYNAISGGLPQAVIDQIIASIGDVDSQTVNVLPYDAISPAQGVEELPGGININVITSASAQAWCDSVGLDIVVYEPLLIRVMTDETDTVNAVQELFLSQRDHNLPPVVCKRVAAPSQGGNWGMWSREETVAGAQAKANAAETNAKNASLPRTGGNIVGEGNILALVGNTHVYQSFYPDGLAAGRKAYIGFGNSDSTDLSINNEYGGELVLSDKYGQTNLSQMQRFKLTQDSGIVKTLPQSYNLDELLTAGQYDGHSLVNGPLGNANGIWFYIEVLAHSGGGGYLMQRATRLEIAGPTLYVRNRVNTGWSPWSPDVFQSGVDAKQGIVNAINAKGGSASMNDTWAMLAAKVQAIETGPKFATGTVLPAPFSMNFQSGNINHGAYPITVSGLSFRPTRIILRTVNFLNPNNIINVYDASIRNAVPNAQGTTSNYFQFTHVNNGSAGSYVYGIDVWEFTGNGTLSSDGAYMNDSGFRLPAGEGMEYKWEAFGV